MFDSYPITLDIIHKEAVVVGGGRIAYRKMRSLLKAGANVTVVSPDIHDYVKQLVDEQRVKWHKKTFQREDIANAFVVIAATNDKNINVQILENSAPHQLVNVVDDQKLSNFHVPAKLQRGKLTITVSTGGASPILARRIRDDLAQIYDDGYGDYVQFLAQARDKVHRVKLDNEVKSQLLYEMTDIN